MLGALMKNFVLAILVGLAFGASAAESPWVRSVAMTNVTSVLPVNASSNVTSSRALRPNRPTGIYVSGIGTNAATSGMTLYFYGSVDNVESNSFPVLTLANTVTSTNKFITFTNINFGILPFLHLRQMTNGGTGVRNLTVILSIEK